MVLSSEHGKILPPLFWPQRHSPTDLSPQNATPILTALRRTYMQKLAPTGDAILSFRGKTSYQLIYISGLQTCHELFVRVGWIDGAYKGQLLRNESEHCTEY